jgi:hypothetical protein
MSTLNGRFVIQTPLERALFVVAVIVISAPAFFYPLAWQFFILSLWLGYWLYERRSKARRAR